MEDFTMTTDVPSSPESEGGSGFSEEVSRRFDEEMRAIVAAERNKREDNATMAEVAPMLDQEFMGLIPVQTDEELALLEANIRADGCRDPLVVWAETGILLDGHTRMSICHRLGVRYNVRRVNLGRSREGARIWIILNQMGRRNLPAERKMAYMDELKGLKSGSNQYKKIEQDAEKEVLQICSTTPQPTENSMRICSPASKTEVLQICSTTSDVISTEKEVAQICATTSEPLKTVAEKAEVAGRSPRTMAYFRKVKTSGSSELLKAVVDGLVSVSRAASVVDLPLTDQLNVALSSKVVKSPVMAGRVIKMLDSVVDGRRELFEEVSKWIDAELAKV